MGGIKTVFRERKLCPGGEQREVCSQLLWDRPLARGLSWLVPKCTLEEKTNSRVERIPKGLRQDLMGSGHGNAG